MKLGLDGRTAVVTGGSKGIGKATALALAEEGVHLHLAARTESDLAEARREIVDRFQVSVTIHPLDLSRSENVDRLVEATKTADILVNNAGAIPAGTLDRIDEATWRAAWDLKVFGFINMCRGMLAHMGARGSGVIVNVVGVAGERHDAKYVAGSVGNAALIALTKTLGGASVDHGVRVVGISPGRIATGRMETQLRRRATMDFGDPERWREYLAGLPFGRAGRPEEVGWLAAFLASDRASYISGTVVTIDGGAVARHA
ncbi:MAG: short-chain dehydrogenase/reductase [Alphaproteobacteria bacterium]